MTQRTIKIDSPYFINEDQLNSPTDLPALFPVERPLILEIGCGIGHFIIELAAANRDKNFLAIDIYNKGCYKTCKKLELLELDNVLVMRVEARYLLLHYIEKQSLAGVYINCPDPWPKKRHRSRRLINSSFMKILLHYLKNDADFFFSTDFTDYAEQVAECLPQIRGYSNRLPELWTTDLPGYPISKYMQRFLDRGQPIYFMHYRRNHELAPDELPAVEIRPGFRSRWERAGNE